MRTQIVTQAQRMKVQRGAHTIQRMTTLHLALFLSWKTEKKKRRSWEVGRRGAKESIIATAIYTKIFIEY